MRWFVSIGAVLVAGALAGGNITGLDPAQTLVDKIAHGHAMESGDLGMKSCLKRRSGSRANSRSSADQRTLDAAAWPPHIS